MERKVCIIVKADSESEIAKIEDLKNEVESYIWNAREHIDSFRKLPPKTYVTVTTNEKIENNGTRELAIKIQTNPDSVLTTIGKYEEKIQEHFSEIFKLINNIGLCIDRNLVEYKEIAESDNFDTTTGKKNNIHGLTVEIGSCEEKQNGINQDGDKN